MNFQSSLTKAVNGKREWFNTKLIVFGISFCNNNKIRLLLPLSPVGKVLGISFFVYDEQDVRCNVINKKITITIIHNKHIRLRPTLPTNITKPSRSFINDNCYCQLVEKNCYLLYIRTTHYISRMQLGASSEME